MVRVVKRIPVKLLSENMYRITWFSPYNRLETFTFNIMEDGRWLLDIRWIRIETHLSWYRRVTLKFYFYLLWIWLFGSRRGSGSK